MKFPVIEVRNFHMDFIKWFSNKYPGKNVLPLKYLVIRYSELFNNFKIIKHHISSRSFKYYDRIFNEFLESPIN